MMLSQPGELPGLDPPSFRPKITILTWALIILGSKSGFMKTRIFILLWSKMLLRRAKFKYVAWSIAKMNFKILCLRIRLTFSSSHWQYCFVYFYPQTSYNLNVQLNSRAQSKQKSDEKEPSPHKTMVIFLVYSRNLLYNYFLIFYSDNKQNSSLSALYS